MCMCVHVCVRVHVCMCACACVHVCACACTMHVPLFNSLLLNYSPSYTQCLRKCVQGDASLVGHAVSDQVRFALTYVVNAFL